MFITAFTTTHHLPYPELDQFGPCHTLNSWKSILILSSHLHLGLPSGLFLSGFRTKTLYAPTLFLIRDTCSTHLILLGLITQIIYGEENRSLSSSLHSFLHSHYHIPLRPTYSQKPLVYIPHSMWVIKFHTHTKKTYSSVYLNLCIFG